MDEPRNEPNNEVNLHSSGVSTGALVGAIVASALVGALLAGGGVYYWLVQGRADMENRVANLEEQMGDMDSEDATEQASTVREDTQDPTPSPASDVYTYSFDSHGRMVDGRAQYDPRFIRTNERTGERKILMSSIKDALPFLQDEFNLTLQEFAQSDGVFVAQLVLWETDIPPQELYKYNVEKNTFEKLDLGEGCDASVSTVKLSPDETRYVSVPVDAQPNAREVHMCNLIDETSEVIATVPQRETLTIRNRDECPVESCDYADIEWVDEETVQYVVFPVDGTSEGETRTVTVPK